MLFPLIVSAAPSQVVLDDQVDVSILSKANTRTPTGRMTAWNVHTHAAFPKYSIRTKEDVKLCDPNVKQVTGYLDVDGDKHFYFWFFESRDKPATDPLVLWLNGGPGCSSFTGLLMELGPCRVNPGGKDTTLNPDSWNSRANVIFLDQPVNTGFSYTEGEDVRTSDKAAEDVYAFLQIFLKDYPKYASSNFTVTGESYAGHYIPAIAHAIQESNLVISQSNPKKLQRVNLESIAIGNGLTDPLVQYEYYPDMACDTKYGPVLDEATCEGMRSKYDTCKSLINACYRWRTPFSCVPGSIYCNSAMIQPFQKTGLNIYDIRKRCDEGNPLCYDIINDIETWANLPEVQDALGVDVQFKGCNMDVNRNFLFAGDWMQPYVNYVPPLLESGIRVMIYAGDADYICNWIGNKAWTTALEWSGSEDFQNAKDILWKSPRTGREAGMVKHAKNLLFVQVYEAGHMVPYDQPEHSLELINMFLHGDGHPKKKEFKIMKKEFKKLYF